MGQIRDRRSPAVDGSRLLAAAAMLLCCASAPPKPAQEPLAVNATVARPTAITWSVGADGKAAINVSSDKPTTLSTGPVPSAGRRVAGTNLRVESSTGSAEIAFVTLTF